MVQPISERRDIDFVLHEMLEVSNLSKNDKFKDFNKKTIDLVINEARNLAIKEILPTQKIGDETGCQFNNGKVTVPKEFHRIYKLYCEGEWIAMADAPELGGQGLPYAVATSCGEYFVGANPAFLMYPGLCHGAGKLVEEFGTDKQKKIFLKNMWSGKWAGTMLLTEAQAGSDVGAVETVAVKNDDGTYSITGSKIFISGGEADLTENIIHPVLARIEGEPEGTKGISLFLVPKIRVNDDGSLGEDNDVVCTGIEEKMGIHGNATCSLTLGGKGNCIGNLLGEKNKGMKAMFVMMNEARLGCGLQGVAMASASYMNAVNYAKERIQGKNLMDMMNPDASAVAIINHPDVRRMLISMKSHVEGMRSLLYFIANCFDIVKTTDNEEEKELYQGYIEFLTPFAKGYCTDRSFSVCSTGVQVYGGYGFITEYPQEQLLRDCTITKIYEGTNGIQSMDLLGRKLAMNGGKPLKEIFKLIGKTASEAKEIEGLKELSENLNAALSKLIETTKHIGATAMSAKILDAFAFSYPYLEAFGDVLMGWMLLWRASIAAPKIKSAKKKDLAFYKGQVSSATYFINAMLPGAIGNMNGILTTDSSVMDIPEDSFAN